MRPTLVICALLLLTALAVGQTYNQQESEVSVVAVSSTDAHILDGADLVVAGGPTHTHGMSRPGTRKMAGKRAGKPGSEAELVPGADSGPGVREWLASLGRLEVAGAAFDTRLQGLPGFTGRASKSIRRHLARHGARIAASPGSFLVEGLTGALVEGELERARAWGERLTRSDCLRGAAGRRQAS